METKKIKAILTDFDQTLFDTRNLKPLWKQKTPDWDSVYAKIPEIQMFEGWKWVQANLSYLPWGVVSGNVKTLINKILKYNKWENFNFVIGRYGEGKRRFRGLPKTELFEFAMQHDGFNELNRNEVLYLGDEATDVEQANQYGFQSAACFWGTLQPEELSATNPTYKLNTPYDLLSVINK